MKTKIILILAGILLIADGLLSVGNGLFGWFTPFNGLDFWWIQLMRIPRIVIGIYLVWLAFRRK